MAQKRRLKSKRVGFRRDATFSKCPSCTQFNTLRRSKTRSAIEGAIKNLTWFKVYRCTNCGWRGYKSTFILTIDGVKLIATYLIIALLTGFAVKYVIQRFVK
jgi:predicted RNA-binding Zn-ribbon protein involved in translation (DUF1610 family)